LVKTVAFRLGFKQVSHFSREFKLQYGVSPTDFLVWSSGQPSPGFCAKHPALCAGVGIGIVIGIGCAICPECCAVGIILAPAGA
jgi:hypothetical protein